MLWLTAGLGFTRPLDEPDLMFTRLVQSQAVEHSHTMVPFKEIVRPRVIQTPRCDKPTIGIVEDQWRCRPSAMRFNVFGNALHLLALDSLHEIISILHDSLVFGEAREAELRKPK